jgi:hypothetical protein
MMILYELMKRKESESLQENLSLQPAASNEPQDLEKENSTKNDIDTDELSSILEKSDEEENHLANNMRMQMVQVSSKCLK